MTDIINSKFPIGSQWKTRGGWRAVIVEYRRDGKLGVWHSLYCGTVCHKADGTTLDKEGLHADDLLTAWIEPRSIYVDAIIYFGEDGRVIGLDVPEKQTWAVKGTTFAAVVIKQSLKEGDGL